MKKVFVSGDFNILHPGHLRLLKFAKESGDYLVVGVHNDKLSNNKGMSQEIRLESINATSYVDESFILSEEASEYIQKNKPDIVVKGKEHEDKENPELEIINAYGGKLIFSSGEIGFTSLELLREDFLSSTQHLKHSPNYQKRHDFSLKELKSVVAKFSELNILVIGDTIVDEYITCEPLGMSQEDPTIVVSPLFTDKFIGGAAIVASHAKTLGAKVEFISVCGDDESSCYVNEGLKSLHIKSTLFTDATRPTTLKQRFRANNKTMLRVNHLKQHAISQELQDKIVHKIQKNAAELDLIIFSDFSYGILTNDIVNKIIEIGKENKIEMVADSQSSSQIGDISKFKNMTLVTPTEREIRLALGDFESGLVVLSEKFTADSHSKYIFTTLGSEGVMIYNTNANELLTDTITALSINVKDVSGAGDSLLTCSSMALCVGADIWQSAYLGSIAAAIQVSRVGNIPLDKKEILKELY